MRLLQVTGIGKKNGDDWILNDIDFTLEKFQKLAIIGESGAGKSTLLKIIAGLIQPDAGNVLLEGKRVEGPLEKLIPGHPAIAYLSQHFELRNNYRVEEILEYANTLTNNEAATIFSVCRIDHLLKRKTDQLSGGEKQRVATARLLISSPQILLLDEPFSNLDRIHKNILKSVIHDIGEKLNITCVLISHDPYDILTWADEVMVMKAGRIIQHGTAYDVYLHPVNIYAGALLGNYNLVPPGAKLFPGLISDTALFIRPENIALTGKNDLSVKGIVSKITFAGAGYEIEIAAGEFTVLMSASSHDLMPGDTVYFTIAHRHDVWKL